MTSTELQDFLNAERANDRKARTLANIARRAQTLLADGYRIKMETGCRFVYGPQGQTYIVFTGNPKTGEDCTCPCFKEHGTCKHYLAVKADVKAQEDALDAQAAREEEVRDFYLDATAVYA